MRGGLQPTTGVRVMLLPQLRVLCAATPLMGMGEEGSQLHTPNRATSQNALRQGTRRALMRTKCAKAGRAIALGLAAVRSVRSLHAFLPACLPRSCCSGQTPRARSVTQDNIKRSTIVQESPGAALPHPTNSARPTAGRAGGRRGQRETVNDPVLHRPPAAPRSAAGAHLTSGRRRRSPR